MPERLSTEKILAGYRRGVFPMAVPELGNRIMWFSPEFRSVIPLDGLKVSRSLKQTIRRGNFTVTTDRAFKEVIRACAARKETWISPQIVDAYELLHGLGHAHSIECWTGDSLSGGLYGIGFDAVFCGESMFSRERDASKVALVFLVQQLKEMGFQLLDVQYMTPHLRTMGAVEIPRVEYLERLRRARLIETEWKPYNVKVSFNLPPV